MSDDPAADLAFECPRCGAAAQDRFYGPCRACRDDLRARLSGQAGERETVEYEPKMNVTPNAVATRE